MCFRSSSFITVGGPLGPESTSSCRLRSALSTLYSRSWFAVLYARFEREEAALLGTARWIGTRPLTEHVGEFPSATRQLVTLS